MHSYTNLIYRSYELNCEVCLILYLHSKLTKVLNFNISERRWTSDEERLYNYLFRRYNRAIRPVKKATDAVEVALTFSLLQIHGLVRFIAFQEVEHC